MDHNDDPEEDPTSDYGESIATSEFTSVNTRQLHSYEHGRYALASAPSPSILLTNPSGDIKASYRAATGCRTMMLSKSERV